MEKLATYFRFVIHLCKKLMDKISGEYYLFKLYSDKNTLLFGNNHIQNTTIGKYSYVALNTIIKNCELGRYCSVGPNVVIGYGDHKIGSLGTHPAIYMNKNQLEKEITKRNSESFKMVYIKNDVWIGASVYIKNGVTIGNGVIVAAGSVITKDVPDFAIVGGVPAKIIRFRFDEDTIKSINNSRWWDKEIDDIDIDLSHFEKTSELKMYQKDPS